MVKDEVGELRRCFAPAMSDQGLVQLSYELFALVQQVEHQQLCQRAVQMLFQGQHVRSAFRHNRINSFCFLHALIL